MGILLTLMGWEPLGEDECRVLRECPRFVLVYPHTSKVDFVILVLYWLSNLTIRERARVLINNYHMERYGRVLGWFGGIDRGKEKGGGVERITKVLEGEGKVILLISPKGVIEKGEWKSGYYYLAKGLECPIVAGGLDYSERRITLTQPISVEGKSVEEVERECKERLAGIIPLYPERAEYGLRMIGRDEPSIMSRSAWVALVWVVVMAVVTVVTVIGKG
jgi:hypothetical protein